MTTDTVPQTVLFPDLFDKPLFAKVTLSRAVVRRRGDGNSAGPPADIPNRGRTVDAAGVERPVAPSLRKWQDRE